MIQKSTSVKQHLLTDEELVAYPSTYSPRRETIDFVLQYAKIMQSARFQSDETKFCPN